MLKLVNVAQIAEFDDIIDVRSPAEFAEDHIPGALNYPVLDNEERARIGTQYKQESPFAAKKAGAVLVSRNIALHLEQGLANRAKNWKPLVYCWRGGGRSGAMAHVLGQVGWYTGQLQGGYQAYRQHVLRELEVLPKHFRWRVICGATGSGKSRVLQALAASGAQVLDLETLARHRGSLLGDLPEQAQPSQKLFESGIWSALRSFDSVLPVYIEAESKKIGKLRVPETLVTAMRAGECVEIRATLAHRVQLLKEEYGHFFSDPERLARKLDGLTELRGKDCIRRWRELAHAGAWNTLVEELLELHYDPAYLKSTSSHFAQYARRQVVNALNLDLVSMPDVADDIRADEEN